jgi:hypothetical protein
VVLSSTYSKRTPFFFESSDDVSLWSIVTDCVRRKKNRWNRVRRLSHGIYLNQIFETVFQLEKTGIKNTYGTPTTKLDRIRPKQLRQVPNGIILSSSFLRRTRIKVEQLGIPAENRLAARMPVFCQIPGDVFSDIFRPVH